MLGLSQLAARTVVLVAAAIGVAGALRLGFWQLDRAAQKLAIEAAIDARAQLEPLTAAGLARNVADAQAQHHRKVTLQGEWIARHTVYLENRQMDGQPGFFVVTPLRLADSPDAVLVQRGWLPRHRQERDRLPAHDTPAGRVEIVGRIAPPPAQLYEFSARASGAIRQNLDLDAFARETGLRLLPLSVQQTVDAAGDTLARRWPRPAADVHKHHGYAFQWFAIAALITGLYGWFQLLRPRFARRT